MDFRDGYGFLPTDAGDVSDDELDPSVGAIEASETILSILKIFKGLREGRVFTIAIRRGIPTSGDAVPKGDKLLAGSRAAPRM